MKLKRVSQGKKYRFNSRRGFVLLLSLTVMFIVFTTAIATQKLALGDLQQASRSITKTKAYFNARSGIEVTLNRLKKEPDLRRLESRDTVKMPEGDFSVDISQEPIAAFEGILPKNLPPDTPVYYVHSIGRIPIRRGDKNYQVELMAVVRITENEPQILLWSEAPVKESL